MLEPYLGSLPYGTLALATKRITIYPSQCEPDHRQEATNGDNAGVFLPFLERVAPMQIRLLSALILIAVTTGSACAQVDLPQLNESQIDSVQYDAGDLLVGVWHSGAFMFQFGPDGRYVYVGEVGGAGLNTRLSEEGTFSVTDSALIATRTSGEIVSSNGYKQPLNPQRTVYGYTLMNTQMGLGMQLVFPNGGRQIFYKER